MVILTKACAGVASTDADNFPADGPVRFPVRALACPGAEMDRFARATHGRRDPKAACADGAWGCAELRKAQCTIGRRGHFVCKGVGLVASNFGQVRATVRAVHLNVHLQRIGVAVGGATGLDGQPE